MSCDPQNFMDGHYSVLVPGIKKSLRACFSWNNEGRYRQVFSQISDRIWGISAWKAAEALGNKKSISEKTNM